MKMAFRRPWNWFLAKLCELAHTCSKMMVRTLNSLSVSHAGLRTHRELNNVLHGPSSPSTLPLSTDSCMHSQKTSPLSLWAPIHYNFSLVLRISAKQLIVAAVLVDPAVRRSSRKQQDRYVCVCVCVFCC
jgi:hypothetical protein